MGLSPKQYKSTTIFAHGFWIPPWLTSVSLQNLGNPLTPFISLLSLPSSSHYPQYPPYFLRTPTPTQWMLIVDNSQSRIPMTLGLGRVGNEVSNFIMARKNFDRSFDNWYRQVNEISQENECRSVEAQR